jgi:hypothetical protein
MKNMFICIIAIFCVESVFAQHMVDVKTHMDYQKSFNDSSAKLVLSNGLVPRAVMTNTKDIICVATNWTEQFPLIAERIDSTGNLLWNGVSLSIPQKSQDTDGNAYILPCPNGGAYFAFEYWEFVKWQDGMEFYAKYPHIQFIDSAGNVQWGPIGKRLTDLLNDLEWGADVQLICSAPDGDILVFWSWMSDRDTTGNSSVSGTYVQKIDPITGELKFGQRGKKLSSYLSNIVRGTNGNIYLFQPSDNTILCINPSLETLWQLPLLTGLIYRLIIGTNDYGELLIIYGTNDNIRASLYDKNGSPIWKDKILSTAYTSINSFTIEQWGRDKWIFNIGEVFCIDRNGNSCWDESREKISGQAIPLDDESVIVTFQKLSQVGSYVRDLYIQKLNRNGDHVWQSDGIKVYENVNTNCVVLPDQNGGAYLIFDALTEYEPQYRPRGTYLQKVDKDGNLGLITSIKGNTTTNNTETTTSLTCYPNPSNGIMTFRMKTGSGNAAGELIVYDILGREVRRFNISSSSYGETFLQWDGKNQHGVEAAPGIYFYYMKTKNNINLSGKFLRIR